MRTQRTLRRLIAFVIAALAASPAAMMSAADPAADALKRRVIEHAQTVTAEDYAFTRTARTEQVEGDKKTERVVVERFDPAKTQRWTLMSIDGRPPSAEELKKHAKDWPKRRVSHYGRVVNYLANADASTVDPRGRTVFRSESLPNETVIVTNVDISASSKCEATVESSGPVPFVKQVRFTLSKPTRIKLIAKVEKFEATNRYRMMPNGKPVLVEHVSNAYGSLLGKQGRVRSVLTHTDHQPVSR